jgi:hypothetical protein
LRVVWKRTNFIPQSAPRSILADGFSFRFPERDRLVRPGFAERAMEFRIGMRFANRHALPNPLLWHKKSQRNCQPKTDETTASVISWGRQCGWKPGSWKIGSDGALVLLSQSEA